MENKELTFGQESVGLNFNHAEGIINQRVHKAKQLAADLIDLVEEHYTSREYPNGKTNELGEAISPIRLSWSSNVFRTAAFNAIIAAQMAVVKFLTWNK